VRVLSTEIISRHDGEQRITRVVLSGPKIRWFGRRRSGRGRVWCKTRHLTLSTALLSAGREVFYETMAFPGHTSLFTHPRGRSFALDCDRLFLNEVPSYSLGRDPITLMEERMIRRLAHGVRAESSL